MLIIYFINRTTTPHMNLNNVKWLIIMFYSWVLMASEYLKENKTYPIPTNPYKNSASERAQKPIIQTLKFESRAPKWRRKRRSIGDKKGTYE